MTTTATLPELHIPPEVLAEVERKSANYEFDNFRERVMEHFPDAVTVEIELVEDPDEEDRNWVSFDVTLPATIEQELSFARYRDFVKDLIERRAHVAQPICSISVQSERA